MFRINQLLSEIILFCSEKTRWEKEARIGVEEFRSLRLRNRQESDKIAEIASNSQETDFNSENSANVETKSEKILKLGKLIHLLLKLFLGEKIDFYFHLKFLLKN